MRIGGAGGFALGGPTGAVIGIIVGGIGGYFITDGLANLVFNAPPVPGATPNAEPETNKGTKQWDKPGDFGTANGDFDSLNPTGVDDKGDGVRVGTFDSGDRIVVRPDSRSGQPT